MMRAQLQTEIVNVRLPGFMLDRARRRAQRQGMTVSELVRHALRSALDES